MQKSAGWLATFSPGYFAFVMATGIVSLAAHFNGWHMVAGVLFWMNVAAYLVIWIFTLARFFRFRGQFLEDLTHHSRGAAFLTAAAGTCVLGSQFVILTSWIGMAKELWFLGFGLAFGLSYLFFTVLTFCEPKPSLEAGINGAWLLVIVAIESVSVLGTLVTPNITGTPLVLFVSVAAYFIGAMLYVFFATLILYRWMFFSMKPEKLTPDYWIDMGALAITTLAGALLREATIRSPLLKELSPFLTGSMLLFWATATWWIPLLSVLELWRHVRGRVPFNYGPEYWTLVFPLGMYAVATFKLVEVTDLIFLNRLAEFFTYVASAAWALVFTGMLRHLARLFAPSSHGNKRRAPA
jgi:tellurite resistance protein TehA-like permease